MPRWTRHLPLPSSNIPLVLNLSKMAIFLHQLPFQLIKGKFMITNSTKYHRLTAILAIVLHLLVVLKWVLDQWLYPPRPAPPIWKYVLMYYFITLFAAIAAFIVHVTVLKKETIFLLNSALQIEQNSKSKGNYIVHTYYIVFFALSMMAIILMPITCFTFGLLRPCMPPTWTSVIYLECKSWDDYANTGIFFRSFGAILLYYFSLSVVATGVFGIAIVLTYPTEVKLILVKLMKGQLWRRTGTVFPCLGTTSHHVHISRKLGVELFVVIVGHFKITGNPFIKSVELLDIFKSMTGSKLIKRLVKSFPPSKLTLGDGGDVQKFPCKNEISARGDDFSDARKGRFRPCF
ncbi:hypothetical protein Fcan01_11279 [Folsomia candida]|uniref:Uncharacterized protein n=1 Tax=Folsomia candida TaxID=158441 RepID=A0A226EA19_FOLCA|nr:hypothetical protein Fcan01_11279 [Folsomia candida]